MNAGRGGHDEFEELAVGWTLYSLEPDDEARFRAHLADCDTCAALVDESTATFGDLARAVPDEGPSPQLRDRLLDAVAQEPQAPPRTAPEPAAEPLAGTGRHAAAEPPVADGPPAAARPPLRRRWKVLAAAAAVVALVAGLGVWNVVVQNDRDHEASLAQLYSRAVQDVTTGGARRAQLTSTSGKPVATVVARDNGIRVVTVALPQNNTRRSVYVLWGVPAHGAPKAIGTFDVTRNGINDRAVPSSEAGARFPAFAVSHEPGRQAPTRPSAVVASGTVSG